MVHDLDHFDVFVRPTTDLFFLATSYDTAQRRFYVPENKLLNLEAILLKAIDSQSTSFSHLDKLAGNCTSMSVAAPPASLYTHPTTNIDAFKRSGGSTRLLPIAVSDRAASCGSNWKYG